MEIDLFEPLNFMKEDEEEDEEYRESSLCAFSEELEDFTQTDSKAFDEEEESQIYNAVSIDKLFDNESNAAVDDVNGCFKYVQNIQEVCESNGSETEFPSGLQAKVNSSSLTKGLPQKSLELRNCSFEKDFSLFCNKLWLEMKELHPDASHDELMTLLRIEWSRMNKNEKIGVNGGKKRTRNTNVPAKKSSSKSTSRDCKELTLKNFKGITGKNQKTGYLMFCSDIRKTIIQQNPEINFSDLGKAMGVEWNHLPEEKKKEYQEKAREVNLQTIKEAQECPKPAVPPSKAKGKLGRSGFSVFQCEYRKELKNRYPNYTRREISQLVSCRWKKLEATEKLRYVHQAAADNLDVESESGVALHLVMSQPDLNRLETTSDISYPHSSSIAGIMGIVENKVVTSTEKKPKRKKDRGNQSLTNGYQIFCVERHKQLKEQMINAAFGDICRLVANEWKKLPSSTKKFYQERAAEKNLEIREKRGNKPVETLQLPPPTPVKNYKYEIVKDASRTPALPSFCTIRPSTSTPKTSFQAIAPNRLEKGFRLPSISTAVSMLSSSPVAFSCQSLVILPQNALQMQIPATTGSPQNLAATSQHSSVPTASSHMEIVSREKLKAYEIYDPLSAYQYFFVEMQKKVSVKYPSLPLDRTLHLIDSEWNCLNESERKILQKRVDQIRQQIEKAKEFYSRHCDTPDSASHMESVDENNDNVDSGDDNESDLLETEDYLDQFSSIEEYFDQLQDLPNDYESQNNSCDFSQKNSNKLQEFLENVELPDVFEDSLSNSFSFHVDGMDVSNIFNEDTSMTSSSHSTQLINHSFAKQSEQGKAHYDQNSALAVSSADGPKPKKVKRIHQSCPKLAFQYFFDEMSKSLRAKNPDASGEGIRRLIESEWKRLRRSDRKILKEEARKEMAREQNYSHKDEGSCFPNCNSMEVPNIPPTHPMENHSGLQEVENHIKLQERNVAETELSTNLDKSCSALTALLLKSQKSKPLIENNLKFPFMSLAKSEFLDFHMDYEPCSDLQRKTLLLFNALVDLEIDGRKPISSIVKLPAKEAFPEYYEAIKFPIDLKAIESKLKMNKYLSIQSLVRDLRFMLKKALECYKRGSIGYKDTILLRTVLNKTIRDYHLEDKPSDDSKAIGDKDLKSFFETVNSIKEKGRPLSKPFSKLADPELLPFYNEIIKDGILMEDIQKKLADGAYESLAGLMADFTKMLDNAFNYFDPSFSAYRSALSLKNLVQKKYTESNSLKEDVPSAKESVQMYLTALYVLVFNHKDAKGKYLSNSLLSLPSYEMVNGLWTKQMTLETIWLKLRGNLYCRLDEFQRDLFCVFQRAHRLSDLNHEWFDDSLNLQKKYILMRDRIFCNGSLIKSRAMSFVWKDLTSLLQVQDGSPNLEAMQSCGTIHEFRTAPSGEQLVIGDFVYVNPFDSESIEDCFVVSIEALWTDSSSTELIYGVHLFKPQDVPCGSYVSESLLGDTQAELEAIFHSFKFCDKDLVKSDISLNLSLSKVVGRCIVLSSCDFAKVQVENFHSNDVYRCKYFYKSSSQTLEEVTESWFPIPHYVVVTERREAFQESCLKSGLELKIEKHQRLLKDEQMHLSIFDSPNRPNVVKKDEVIENMTFYIWYNAGKVSWKIGDFVYMKVDSENDRFILHINRIAVDNEGVGFLIGSKFIIQEMLDHSLAAYSLPPINEVYLVSHHEAYLMSSVTGKCMVLNFNDYRKLRCPEIPEEDVYLCEYFFNAERHCLTTFAFDIVKYNLPPEVVPDEFLYFPKVLQMSKYGRPHTMNGKKLELKYAQMNCANTARFENFSFSPHSFADKKPKRICKIGNLYFFYQRERLKALMLERPELSHRELFVLISQEWKTFSNSQKEELHLKMKEEMKQYPVEEGVEEYLSDDERMNTRNITPNVRSKVKIYEGGAVDNRNEELSTWHNTMLSWLYDRRKMDQVVTCKEFRESAAQIFKRMKLRGSHQDEIMNFKSLYREELRSNHLIKDGRGRHTGVKASLKNKMVYVCANETNLKEQCNYDKTLLDEFDIADCRVIVNPLKLSAKSKTNSKRRRMRRRVVFRRMKRTPRIRRCPKCKVVFATKCKLDVHLRQEHKDEGRKCKLCSKSFSKRGNFASHMLWHCRMKKCFHCLQCLRDFVKKESYESHMQQHLEDGTSHIKPASLNTKPKSESVPLETNAETCGIVSYSSEPPVVGNLDSDRLTEETKEPSDMDPYIEETTAFVTDSDPLAIDADGAADIKESLLSCEVQRISEKRGVSAPEVEEMECLSTTSGNSTSKEKKDEQSVALIDYMLESHKDGPLPT